MTDTRRPIILFKSSRWERHQAEQRYIAIAQRQAQRRQVKQARQPRPVQHLQKPWLPFRRQPLAITPAWYSYEALYRGVRLYRTYYRTPRRYVAYKRSERVAAAYAQLMDERVRQERGYTPLPRRVAGDDFRKRQYRLSEDNSRAVYRVSKVWIEP